MVPEQVGTEEPMKDRTASSLALLGAAPRRASYDVFFCYNGKDFKVIQRLYAEVEIAGLRVWLDQEVLVPGERWPAAVQDALESVAANVVFLGPSGFSPHQRNEVQAILARQSRRVIPVFLCEAPEDMELPAIIASYHALDFRLLAPSAGIAKLIQGIRLSKQLARQPQLEIPGQYLRRETPELESKKRRRAKSKINPGQFYLPGLAPDISDRE